MKTSEKLQLLEEALEKISDVENILLRLGMVDAQKFLSAFCTREIDNHHRHLGEIWAREMLGHVEVVERIQRVGLWKART